MFNMVLNTPLSFILLTLNICLSVGIFPKSEGGVTGVYKNAVLKNFVKFKKSTAQVFPSEFYRTFENSFSVENLRTTARGVFRTQSDIS